MCAVHLPAHCFAEDELHSTRPAPVCAADDVNTVDITHVLVRVRVFEWLGEKLVQEHRGPPRHSGWAHGTARDANSYRWLVPSPTPSLLCVPSCHLRQSRPAWRTISAPRAAACSRGCSAEWLSPHRLPVAPPSCNSNCAFGRVGIADALRCTNPLLIDGCVEKALSRAKLHTPSDLIRGSAMFKRNRVGRS